MSILQVEDPLQKFLATALSSQQQQQDENGHLAGGNPGKQSSSRTSSSNQSESSSISPKRSAAKERDASSDPPPVKRSPGRPPGSPNKVIFAKIVAKQKLCIFWFGNQYLTLVRTVQVKKDKTVSPPSGRPRETTLNEFVCECGFSSASERGLNIHRRWQKSAKNTKNNFTQPKKKPRHHLYLQPSLCRSSEGDRWK